MMGAAEYIPTAGRDIRAPVHLTERVKDVPGLLPGTGRGFISQTVSAAPGCRALCDWLVNGDVVINGWFPGVFRSNIRDDSNKRLRRRQTIINYYYY